MRRKLLSINAKLFACLVLMMSFLTFGANSQNIADGLILHYDFSNGTVDATGNGYDGVLNSEAAVTMEDDENALYLPTGTESYLQVDTASGFDDALASLINYSVSAKMKITSRGVWRRVFDFGSGTGNYMFLSTTQYDSNSAPRFAIKPNSGGSEDGMTGTNTIPMDKWVSVVVTVDGSEAKLYVDGVLEGSNSNVTISPATLGAANFTQCYIGKSQWPDAFLEGYIADFRVYDRAVTETEVFMLGGIPIELLNARQAVTTSLGDLTEITSNITLPLTQGEVKVDWTTNNADVVDSTGVVTQPDKYSATATLLATFSYNGDTITQDYVVTVLPQTEGDILIARWTYDDQSISVVSADSVTVTDVSESGFVGALKNEASIVTIGETTQFNVLDLGNGQGYFDMGTEIGKAVYSLTDYTIGAYYRIDDDYTELSSNGNFLWNFGNTDDIDAVSTGYMGIRMLDQRVSITSTIFGANQQTVNPGTAGAQGQWAHVAYVQSGTTGSIYINGVLAATGTVTNLPATTLVKEGKLGTLFNWLGRSCYVNDVYLRKTKVYDFRLYNVAASSDDVPYVFGDEDMGYGDITEVISALDAAYAENSNNLPESLVTETDALDLGDLSAVTSDITLPTAGTNDPSISIVWTTSNDGVVGTDGVVTRPEFLDRTVVLTAKLIKGAQYLTKTFEATVVASESSAYSSDLLINYDFSIVNDTVVTDVSEKAFTGVLKNGAEVKYMSDGFIDYNVLNLTNDTAYFDMGTEVGKVAYGLGKHFSVSVYYFIDEYKTNFNNNGNFVWTFSNSDSSDVYRNGYMFGRAPSNGVSISSEYWAAGNQSVANSSVVPVQGAWYHMTYVQDDTMGVVYINGDTVASGKMTNYPYLALPKEGLDGTMYNFLGRPNFSSDTYLGKAMIYDFKVYNKSLSVSDIENMQSARDGLDIAYFLSLSTSDKVLSDVEIVSAEPGIIVVNGKADGDLVEVYDITGRMVVSTYESTIDVNPGLYIVKAGSAVQKVIVK